MVLSKLYRVLRKWRPCRSVLLESRSISDQALLFEADCAAVLTGAEADLIRKEYTESSAAYGCLGVLQADDLSYLVLLTRCGLVGRVPGAELYRITNVLLIPLHATPHQHEAALDIAKLLSSGFFYFSHPTTTSGTHYTLLASMQQQSHPQQQFCWNRSMSVYLRQYGVDTDQWVLPIICGSVIMQTVYVSNKQVKACLISRVSSERAGTRFNVRGLNDEGHTANFVETEQVLFCDDAVTSFVQVRGLVPVFWEQTGIQAGAHKLRLSRSFECSHPAFEKHFEYLLKQYGAVMCLNLLGRRDMETLLSEAFDEHLAQLSLKGAADMIQFDYHSLCPVGRNDTLTTTLLPACQEFLRTCDFYVSRAGITERAQTGTLRHNCLDCLDRTNTVQAFLALHVLPLQLETLGLSARPNVMMTRFKQWSQRTWTQNGDSISRLYAGSRALDGKGKVGKLRDGARSVQRTIKNNFMDAGKQEAIDLLLSNGVYWGQLGQSTRALLSAADAFAPYPVRQALCHRWSEYADASKLRVGIGTWNVNGGRHVRSVALKNHSMHEWLLDFPMPDTDKFPSKPVDVYAIGFQELVGLTAANMVSTSSSNRVQWGAELEVVLSRNNQYCLLTAEQLVGVCLFVFVRPHLIPYIRDVAVCSVKTGIGGKAGNKGAVAIRLLLHSSSLCFVCSHFAAHQTKVMERNQDFAEIFKKAQFSSGQTIDSHDYVFWCGDLNYRIELPLQLAKDTITAQDWDKLIRHDQLIKQKRLGRVFQGFAEGSLDFAPTYKYDEFSDDYDTSEKGRVPAWCDRVLWRRKSFLPPASLTGLARVTDDATPDSGLFGTHTSDAARVYERELSSGSPDLDWWHPGRLLYYGRAELKTSDHRPVFALLEVDVVKVDEKRRKEVREKVTKELGPFDRTVVVTVCDDEKNSIDVNELLTSLQQYGDIVLVRATDDATLVTFQHSKSALQALQLRGEMIGDHRIDVKLRSDLSTADKDPSVSGKRLSMLLTGTQLSRGAAGGREEDGQDIVIAVSDGEDGVEDEEIEDNEDEEAIEIDDSVVKSSNGDSTKPVRPPRPQPPQRHTEESDVQHEDESPDDSQQPSEDIGGSVNDSSRKPVPERPSRPTRPPPHSRPRRQDTAAHQEEQEHHSPAHHDNGRSREKSPRPSRPPPPKLVSSVSVSQSASNLPPQRPPRPSLPPRGRSVTTINPPTQPSPVPLPRSNSPIQHSPTLLPRTSSSPRQGSPVPAPRSTTNLAVQSDPAPRTDSPVQGSPVPLPRSNRSRSSTFSGASDTSTANPPPDYETLFPNKSRTMS